MVCPFQEVSIDEVRDYWNRHPCNIRHSSRSIGQKEYFDEVEQRKYFVEPHIPDFADFPAWQGKRVLEIGCGIGTDTINFGRAEARVTAVDLSSESLDVARKRAQVFGVANRIDFVEADVEHLPEFLPVEPYDLIYSFGVIHHTPDPEAALRAIRPYLAPHGILKLMMYHRWSWKMLWLLFTKGKLRFWDLDRTIAKGSEARAGCPVTYSYSRRRLRALLRRTGYEPREISIEHIFSWSIPEYVRYKHRKIWYFRMLPYPLFRWLERRLGWHLCATADAR